LNYYMVGLAAGTLVRGGDYKSCPPVTFSAHATAFRAFR
jgi:hypothetical protein